MSAVAHKIKNSPLARRLHDIVQRNPNLPEFIQAKIDQIPNQERHTHFAVFDADGVIWKEDIADEVTGWMILSGYTDKKEWYEYERVYRPNHEAGCIHLLSAFKGTPMSVFDERVLDFYMREHEKLCLRETVCATMVNLKKLGFRTAIVTASPTSMLWPAAELLGADTVLGMDFEVDAAGLITGKLKGMSCYGNGKAQKVIDFCGGKEHVLLCAGDAPLDVAMMEVGQLAWACQPDAQLLAVAQQKGWHILHRPQGEPVGCHADKFDKWSKIFP